MRYLVVGTDAKTTEEDSKALLNRWIGTDLQFEVWRHENKTQTLINEAEDNNLDNKTLFLLRCLQNLYQQENLGWVALIEPDKYLAVKPLVDLSEEQYEPIHFLRGKVRDVTVGSNKTLADHVTEHRQQRHLRAQDTNNSQRDMESTPSVVEVLESQQHILPCQPAKRRLNIAGMDNFSKLDKNDLAAADKIGNILVDLRCIPFRSLADVTLHALLRECNGSQILNSRVFNG